MQKEEDKDSSGRGVLRSAAAMSLGTLSSRILGMVRDIVITAFFSRTVTDGFYVAFRLPNMFRRLLGEGSLAVSFIPVYIENRNGPNGESAGKQLASSIFTCVLTVTSVLSVMGVVFMDPLMRLLLSGEGYVAVEGKTELTIHLGQIMFSYLFLVTSYAFLTAISQAHKRFFIPALAPALFNLIFIVFAFLPQSWVTLPADLLAWGVIAGGLAQVTLVIGLLIRMGHFPRLRWRWSGQGFFTVLRNMVPGMIGMGVFQFLGFANLHFASRLPEGAHSYIYLGDRVLELPQSLIAISLGAAILPTLSDLWSKGRAEEMRAEARRQIKLLLFLAIPSAIGMGLLAQPIVEVLFYRNEFAMSDVVATAQVVQIYAIMLLASSVNKVMIPSFFAIKNTWLPAAVSAFAVFVHLFVANWAVGVWGLQGLVGSTAFSNFLNVFLILFFYKKMIGDLGWPNVFQAVTRMVPALAALALWVFFAYGWIKSGLVGITPHFFAEALGFLGMAPVDLARVLSLGITIGGAVFFYFYLNRKLQVPEADTVLSLVKRR